MKHRVIVCFLFLSASLVGCFTSKKVGTSSNSVKSDSSWTVVTSKPMIIEVPGRTVNYSFPIKCDSITNKPVPVKGNTTANNVEVSYEVDVLGNLLNKVTCLDLELQVEQLQTDNFRLIKELNDKVEYREVKVAAWYDIVCRWIAAISILIILFKIFI